MAEKLYALNLENRTHGRVLSVTFDQYAPEWQPRVTSFPEGVSNYRYEDGEFIYDPLPEEEEPPTDQERIEALEQQNEMLLECLLEISELVYS